MRVREVSSRKERISGSQPGGFLPDYARQDKTNLPFVGEAFPFA
jgi:hypothetical protein